MSKYYDEIVAMMGKFLDDYGFEKKRDIYDEAHFGDTDVHLRSERLNLRLSRERGQWFLSVGPAWEPNDWYEIGDVIEARGGEVKDTTELEELSGLFTENYESLCAAFTREAYLETRKCAKSIERRRRVQ